ncbi:hypothetical protein TIFTF001_025942 [Ficus carica]|uniref:C2H2-type domain-containing protein n=1 Tax=Ficus carica TaxID=3494 RepID=A0AA88DEN7_FICCA|nr:hypothetical protein TIFTF001_025942 [Ficus carica]
MFCSGKRQHIYASKRSLTKPLEPRLFLLVQEFWSIKQNQVSRASSLQSLRKMKNSIEITCFAFLGLLFLQRIVHVSSSSPLTNSNQASEGSAGSGTLKQEAERAFEVHCSRERSRTAWKIIEDYLMPFMEQERYQISNKCRLHPDNDIFRDQEQHKIHVDMNEWQCGYCKKSFRAEKFLDQHFDNRHQNLLNVSGSKCIADLCGALHCDHVMHTKSRKTKCNPVAVARNRHICESLADDCFPIQQGASASHLHGANECAIPGSVDIDFDATPPFLCSCFLAPKVSLLAF